MAAAANKFVKLERMKNVLLIGLNRADKCNAVNSQVAKELTAAVEELERDDVRWLLI